MTESVPERTLYWPYLPSLPAAIVFCVLYAILTAGHILGRCRKDLILANCLIAGGIFETIGYGFRTFAHYHLDARMPYTVQAFFILVAPNLFAASIYHSLEALTIASGINHLCVLEPRLTTRLFLLGDGLAFAALIAGCGFVDSDFFQGAIRCGNYLIIAGLILQTLLLWVFTGFTVVFLVRLSRRKSYATQDQDRLKKVKKLLMLICTGAQIIAGRNMFRLTTTAMNPTGYMAEHEWTFYVFDGVQLAQVMIINLAWYHCRLDDLALIPRDASSLSSERDFSLGYGHLQS